MQITAPQHHLKLDCNHRREQRSLFLTDSLWASDVVARFIGHWERCLSAINRRTTAGSPPLAGELEGVGTEALTVQLRKSSYYRLIQHIREDNYDFYDRRGKLGKYY